MKLQDMVQNDLEDFGVLDILSLWSVYAQYKGIKTADKDRDFNTVVLKIISNEIQKLHQENEEIYKQNIEIIEQNKELLELLRGEKNAREDKKQNS